MASTCGGLSPRRCAAGATAAAWPEGHSAFARCNRTLHLAAAGGAGEPILTKAFLYKLPYIVNIWPLLDC